MKQEKRCMLCYNYECLMSVKWFSFQSHCDHPSNCRFHWNAKHQGLVLGGFAIGYVLTQFIGAFLAERFGGKYVFGIGLLLCSVGNFILPIMTVNFETPVLTALRIMQGALQGLVVPAMYSLTAKWTPKPEKNRMMTFMISG